MEPSLSADVLIVGGSYAGLAALTSISHQRYTAICFDSKEYRDEGIRQAWGLPTWDGKSPQQFRDEARKDIADRYDTATFVDTKITRVTKLGKHHFEVEDNGGKKWTGKILVLATGIEDVLPSIDGFEECWGESIYFDHTNHSDGYRGSPSSGVLAINDSATNRIVMASSALALARFCAKYTNEVTIYTNASPTLAKDLRSMTGEKAPFKVDDRFIAGFKPIPSGTGVVIKFQDGSSREETFVRCKPASRLRGTLAKQLGLKMESDACIKHELLFNETSVSGCFAAGDNSSHNKSVVAAISAGNFAATGAGDAIESAKYGQKSLQETTKEVVSGIWDDAASKIASGVSKRRSGGEKASCVVQ